MIRKKKTRPAPWTQTKTQQQLRRQDSPQRKRVNPMSSKRRAENPIYLKRSRAFLARERAAGKVCPVASTIIELIERRASTRLAETHHLFGRAAELYLWEPGWMGVSSAGHKWIDAHPDEARKRGWLAPKGLYNSARKVISIANAIVDVSCDDVMERFLTLNGYGR